MSSPFNTVVAQFYVAMFGRAPDAEGLAFWRSLLESGQALSTVADTMFDTTPARDYFPADLGNEAIIAAFYQNVLGRTADADGLAYWTAKLNAAGATPGSVIVEMIGVIANYAGGDPAGLASAFLFNNRAQAAQAFGEYDGSLDGATRVLHGITAEAWSLPVGDVLTVASGAKGTIDAAGYAAVSIGQLSGDLRIVNLADDTLLAFRDSSQVSEAGAHDPEWVIRCELADATGGHDGLRVMFLSENLNAGQLELPGIESLAIGNFTGAYDELASTLYFVGETSLDWVTAAGDGALRLLDVSAASMYGNALTQSLNIIGGAPLRVIAGPGDDFLPAGPAASSVTGGAGEDFFLPRRHSGRTDFLTIEDFTPGTDSIGLYDLLPPGGFSLDFGVWHGAQLSVPAASFNTCLNAAAARKTTADAQSAISWFQYQGDTFIVVDNAATATFSTGTDQIVKLIGLVDLSALSYGTTGDFVPAVLS